MFLHITSRLVLQSAANLSDWFNFTSPFFLPLNLNPCIKTDVQLLFVPFFCAQLRNHLFSVLFASLGIHLGRENNNLALLWGFLSSFTVQLNTHPNNKAACNNPRKSNPLCVSLFNRPAVVRLFFSCSLGSFDKRRHGSMLLRAFPALVVWWEQKNDCKIRNIGFLDRSVYGNHEGFYFFSKENSADRFYWMVKKLFLLCWHRRNLAFFL